MARTWPGPRETRVTVRTSRSGTVTDLNFNNNTDNQSYQQSSKKEEFSQTEFNSGYEQEIVLGKYLESKLGQDFSQLKVKLSANNENSDDNISATHNKQTNLPPDIVIVEYDQEEII